MSSSYAPSVRLVIARCSVSYDGRLTAELASALRLLLVKADGSVSIHADGGAYKPLNWMSPPCTLKEEPGLWTVTNKAGETLTITIEELVSDTSYELGVDPVCARTVSKRTCRSCSPSTATSWGTGGHWCAGSTPPTSDRSTCCVATPMARRSPSRSSGV